ncbi:WD40-repeat-containing domain protein [Lentinula edodes]|uniref:WD40-repeat-containing domain protein n=1 Tax=Lentinula lateritia TaxID=40482 RepID=A0A9W9DMA9_9AGAR|nr:WD40-repeat-containing domain protein [Lentinula edodes]
MPKHSRKRQKLSNEANPLTDDSAKDDEERTLESLLFGTKYVPVGNNRLLQDDAEATEGDERQFQNLLDNDLFFVDDEDEHNSDRSDFEDQEPSGSGSGSQSENEEGFEEPPTTKKPRPHPKSLQSNRRAPAWIDDSDPTSVSLSSKRLRKLRNAPDEDTLTGREYESRLRRQFGRINPEPDWATQARKKTSQTDDGDGDAKMDFNTLLSSTSGIHHSGSLRSEVLAPGIIDISRLRDANQSAQNSGCGDIKSLAFHPSERVPVLCVGSSDRRVRMYNIDGHTSPLLQTLHIPSLPLSSQSSVVFHPSGSHLLLTGSRPYYFIYDLQSGTLTGGDQSKHGLWGTRFEDPAASLEVPMSFRKRGRTRGAGVDESASVKSQNTPGAPGMEVTAFEPRTGGILAVAGRGGYVHLVDWKSGAGQVIGSLKCSNGGGGVKGLWWASSSSERYSELDTGSREYLTVLTGDSEVYVWDVGQRRCVRRWTDEGGFRGSGRVLAGSGKGSGWLAIGSNTGLVNVYGTDSYTPSTVSTSISSSSSWSGLTPKPLKTVENLTTPISTLRFNHDAQVLAMASKEKKDSMRLIHLPSLTSFSNWPTSSTPLGHVTAVEFSARSEYIAIGNTRGRVLLYHLKNFGAH